MRLSDTRVWEIRLSDGKDAQPFGGFASSSAVDAPDVRQASRRSRYSVRSRRVYAFDDKAADT